MKTKNFGILSNSYIPIFSIVLIFFSLNIYFSRHYKKNLKNLTFELESIAQDNIDISNENILMKKLIRNFYDKDSLNRKLNFILDNNLELKQSLNEEFKLVLFFKEGVCGACLFKILLDLEILANKIGKENIIILTSWGENDKPIVVENNKFKNILVNTNLIGDNNPILFVISNHTILNLFIPNLYPDYQQQYFSKVIPDLYQNLKI